MFQIGKKNHAQLIELYFSSAIEQTHVVLFLINNLFNTQNINKRKAYSQGTFHSIPDYRHVFRR